LARPVPTVNYTLSDSEIEDLKLKLLGSGLTRTGINKYSGIVHEPLEDLMLRIGCKWLPESIKLLEIDWIGNERTILKKSSLRHFNQIQNGLTKKVSIADLIVLGWKCRN
jgi:catalase-peroxidase